MSGKQTNALFYAMKAIRPRSGHGAAVRSVLFVLANFYNERTHCAWPAVNTLAKAAGVSKNTARKAIDILVALGLVAVLPTKRIDSGAQGPNLYRLPQYCDLPVNMCGDMTKAGRHLADYELVDGAEFETRREKAKQTVARKKQPPQLVVLQEESRAAEPEDEPFVSRRRQRALPEPAPSRSRRAAPEPDEDDEPPSRRGPAARARRQAERTGRPGAVPL